MRTHFCYLSFYSLFKFCLGLMLLRTCDPKADPKV
jgi:hypothetical protein